MSNECVPVDGFVCGFLRKMLCQTNKLYKTFSKMLDMFEAVTLLNVEMLCIQSAYY